MARINLSNKGPYKSWASPFLTLYLPDWVYCSNRPGLGMRCPVTVRIASNESYSLTLVELGQIEAATTFWRVKSHSFFSLSYSRSQCGNGAAIRRKTLKKKSLKKKSSHRVQINSHGLNFRASAKKSLMHFCSLIFCTMGLDKHLESILVKMFVENLAPENKFNKKMTFSAWARTLFVLSECIPPLWNVSLWWPGQISMRIPPCCPTNWAVGG